MHYCLTVVQAEANYNTLIGQKERLDITVFVVGLKMLGKRTALVNNGTPLVAAGEFFVVKFKSNRAERKVTNSYRQAGY